MTGAVEARKRLLDARDESGAWGYRRDTLPAVEPTALSGLALLATAGGPDFPEAATAAGWLARSQRPDGSLGVSAALAEPCWPTPHALLLWEALGGFGSQSARAEAWLLGSRGLTEPLEAGRVVEIDTTLEGWSWVPDSFSWLEPTAMAVLALLGRDRASHPRVREGLRLIRDRALEGGGWNYGNTAVFGRQTRPQPATTGLALLALARAGDRTPAVAAAVRYLLATLPSVRSAQSLGWGLLALRAWGVLPQDADRWLAEAAEQAFDGREPAPNLALLLLAAAEGTPALLGIGRLGPCVIPRP